MRNLYLLIFLFCLVTIGFFSSTAYAETMKVLSVEEMVYLEGGCGDCTIKRYCFGEDGLWLYKLCENPGYECYDYLLVSCYEPLWACWRELWQ